MLNTITIQGRFTETPVLKTTTNGLFVTAFTLAVPRDYKDKNGREITDFLNFVAWKETADFICKYFEKGAEVIIRGALETRKYKDKNDNNRIAFEIKVERAWFAGSKKEKEAAEPTTAAPSLQDFEEITDEDDLPF